MHWIWQLLESESKPADTYHILNVGVFGWELCVEWCVEPADDKVAIVLVLHEFLDAAALHPADPLAVQHAGDDVLQELLVLAVGAGPLVDGLLPLHVLLLLTGGVLHQARLLNQGLTIAWIETHAWVTNCQQEEWDYSVIEYIVHSKRCSHVQPSIFKCATCTLMYKLIQIASLAWYFNIVYLRGQMVL